jgi:hypothetical protein
MMKPRFNLKLLLITVALLGTLFGWLSAERRYVKQREAFVIELADRWRVIDATGDRGFYLDNGMCVGSEFAAGIPRSRREIPFIRRLMGGQSVQFVVLPENSDEQFIDRAIDLFPEAVLRRSIGKEQLVDIREK